MLKFIDLFSGIGSFSKELEATGTFECVLACDNNRRVKETYLLNHNLNKKYFANEIGSLNELLNFQEEDYFRLKDCDLLTAGIPCQSFSLMGSKDGLSNGRTSKLIEDFMQFVKIITPKVILLENVTRFKKLAFDPILEPFFKSNGYNYIDTAFLNCRHFSIPQNRNRFFAVVTRLNPEFLNVKDFFNFERMKTPSIKEFLNLKVQPDRDYSICIRTSGYSKNYNRRNFMTLLCTDEKGKKSFIRLNMDDIMRLQGFDDLIFPENCPKGDRYWMLGNSIPRNLTRLIARRLSERFHVDMSFKE